MPCQIATAYYMIGCNGRTPTTPQPKPTAPPPEKVDFAIYNSGFSNDSEFAEWNEAYIANAEGEVAEQEA
jgi:hypothetical protein